MLRVHETPQSEDIGKKDGQVLIVFQRLSEFYLSKHIGIHPLLRSLLRESSLDSGFNTRKIHRYFLSLLISLYYQHIINYCAILCQEMIVEQFKLILLVLVKISSLDLFQHFIDFLTLELLVSFQDIDSLEVRMIFGENGTMRPWDSS
jgi:hypothetical protein